jgi:hypothetical protein
VGKVRFEVKFIEISGFLLLYRWNSFNGAFQYWNHNTAQVDLSVHSIRSMSFSFADNNTFIPVIDLRWKQLFWLCKPNLIHGSFI